MRKKNGTLFPQGKQKFYSSTSLRAVYDTYKKKTLGERRLDFDMPWEVFEKLTAQNCYYCGLPPSNVYHRRNSSDTAIYSGIDRIDNSQGYVLGNIVPCCKDCNFAKGAKTLEQWNSWIGRLLLFRAS